MFAVVRWAEARGWRMGISLGGRWWVFSVMRRRGTKAWGWRRGMFIGVRRWVVATVQRR